MSPAACVIGIDYGTLSGRALVARVADGAQLGSSEHRYAHGVIDTKLPSTDESLPPSWSLQHPGDYLDVLYETVPAAVASAGIDPGDVVGLGTDFTACTVMPVTSAGTPLCLIDSFSDSPHAWVKLWRHHGAQAHADRINALAVDRDEPWRGFYGGKQSSEWELAKALEVFEADRVVYEAMDLWVEAADWIVWQLTGSLVRSAALAGYKGARQRDAYPSSEFFEALSPGFGSFVGDKLAGTFGRLGDRAGDLDTAMAERLGLRPGIAVCVGNVDAHVTSPAANCTRPGQMLAVMGTSTCHILNGSKPAEVPGMCGVVDGGVSPGLWGFEAGQSGVGDDVDGVDRARGYSAGGGEHESRSQDAQPQGRVVVDPDRASVGPVARRSQPRTRKNRSPHEANVC